MLMDVREYIDRLQIDGHTIGEDHDDDPVLLDATGRAVDTWRENYPYDERMSRHESRLVVLAAARLGSTRLIDNLEV